jgi:oxalate decarboxylase/phosphoglucose isomerase-like protein (cupin superfamily)
VTAPSPAHENLQVGADELTVRATSAESGGALFAAEVVMKPGGGPPFMHRHAPGELYHVLQGEFAFYIADAAGTVHRTTGEAGAVVPIPGGRPHTIRNESATTARAFVVYAPGGPMERFVRAAAALAAERDPQPHDVLELGGRHGIEMAGPIPTAGDQR